MFGALNHNFAMAWLGLIFTYFNLKSAIGDSYKAEESKTFLKPTMSERLLNSCMRKLLLTVNV